MDILRSVWDWNGHFIPIVYFLGMLISIVAGLAYFSSEDKGAPSVEDKEGARVFLGLLAMCVTGATIPCIALAIISGLVYLFFWAVPRELVKIWRTAFPGQSLPKAKVVK